MSDLKIKIDSNIIEKLMNIHEHPELKEQLAQSIPMIINNGIKTIDPSFIKETLDLDPLLFASRVFESDEKTKCAGGVFFIHLKSAMQKIIDEISHEFSEQSSTWEQYLTGVKSLGFRELFVIPHTKENREKDFIAAFWNDEHSMLWVLDSFTWSDLDKPTKVNGSNLYFNAHLRNESERGWDLRMNRGITSYTNVTSASIDMRDAPTYKFFEILRCFKPVEYWAEYDCYESRLNDNLELIEKDVLAKMIYNNAALPTYIFDNNKNKDLVENKLKPIVDEIIQSMTEEELYHSSVFSHCLQYIEERVTFIPQKYQDLLSTKVESQFLENAVGLFAYTINQMLIKCKKEYDDYNDKVTEALTPKELIPVYNRFVRKGEDGRKYEISKDAFERLEEKVKSC